MFTTVGELTKQLSLAEGSFDVTLSTILNNR